MNYIQDLATRIRRNIPAGVSLPDDADYLFNIYALLALTKGKGVTGEDVHNAWSVWMHQRNPHHESLIPYKQLAADVKAMDLPYVEAIRNVSKDLE